MRHNEKSQGFELAQEVTVPPLTLCKHIPRIIICRLSCCAVLLKKKHRFPRNQAGVQKTMPKYVYHIGVSLWSQTKQWPNNPSCLQSTSHTKHNMMQ